MKSTKLRAYSRYSREAVVLLGKLIKLNRKERKLTTYDVADRAGITRFTLRKIENGDLHCQIGLVLEVATVVGVTLFAAKKSSLTKHGQLIEDRLTLLPKSIHKPKGKIEDDF